MNPRRRFFRSSVGLTVSTYSALHMAGRAAQAQSNELTFAEDDLIKTSIAAGDIPGAVAMVVDPNQTLYQGAFGARAFGQEAPMQMDTVLWIASMTKPLVAVAAMQLVERGVLSLDEPASKCLPALGSIKVLTGFDRQGQPLLRNPSSPITLRRLLNHTAGFSYDLWDANLAKYHQVTGAPHSASGKKAGLLLPLSFDPGTRWEYGINYDWIGLMIEAATGMRLGQYLAEHLTGPLGMDSTSFAISAEMRQRMAKIHKRDTKHQFITTPIEAGAHAEFESGGAGLYSTATDYAKFMQMILNHGSGNGHQILKPETLVLMTGSSTGPIPIDTLVSQSKVWSNDIDLLPGIKKSWGLGWMINETRTPSGRPTGSLAWAGVANTFFWIDLEQRKAGLLMMQLLPFLDRKALQLFDAFERTANRNIS